MKKCACSLTMITIVLLGTGCSVSRDIGAGKPIGFYDYCVVSEKNTGEYYERAKSILGQPFVTVEEVDSRLVLPSVLHKTCTVSIDWAPGFWSTSGWVALNDWNGEEVFRSSVRR